MKTIHEKDWKLMRKLKDELLDQVCERIFQKVEAVSGGRGGHQYKSYLDLWKLLEKEDKRIGDMFDDLKRSNALIKLAHWRRCKLISDEVFSEFSEETRQNVNMMVGFLK